MDAHADLKRTGTHAVYRCSHGYADGGRSDTRTDEERDHDMQAWNAILRNRELGMSWTWRSAKLGSNSAGNVVALDRFRRVAANTDHPGHAA
jgi:hypothetical protein